MHLGLVSEAWVHRQQQGTSLKGWVHLGCVFEGWVYLKPFYCIAEAWYLFKS